ncbi:hypothetical protein CFK39_08175 [Brachybacterium avium]|uniref:Serine/threonine protein kinase n=1 Tax=Brachybacterium avium TaxID=2017485 RepID=A0A220UD27_9MICO|nr:hypothetical protein [Brachybacterium avium]ASK65812.1 hypothetical protein CFK39_08175 [Brachybacterium avium]
MNTNPQPDALRSRWTLEGQVPLSGVADGAVWHRARSISTGEDVVLFVVQGEAALEAADAVRRAYLVEDPRLLTVKDIVVFDDPRDTSADQPTAGSAEGPTTVVEYALPPAPPLAALLAKGPLHPETARAIIGEAATGLEAARRRGVRHQFLDSNRVFVDTGSGQVVLLGIGVEAAAHPGLDRSREVASFQDTAALVALLYRALTGRSPRHDATGTVPRPSTIVDTAIPEDLDLLCDLVLNESADEIPETTRGLIEALQPWQSIPVTVEAYAHTTRPASADDAPAGVAAGAAIPTAAEDATSADTESEEDDGDELESTALMDAVPDQDEAELPSSAGQEHPAEDTAADTSQPESPDPAPSAALATGAAAGAVAGAGAVAADAAAPAGSPVDRPEDREPPAQTTEDETSDRDEESRHTSSEASALVSELQLDQKRGTSPFPGHLEITLPPEPEPVPEPVSGPDPEAAESAGSAAGAAAAGATSDIPSRTAGAHWPLARSESRADGQEPSLAPSTPSPAAPGSQPPSTAGASVPSAVTPDHSAPTPSQPVTHSTDAAPSAPVPVSGRSSPVARGQDAGPIVVHGRDRSVSEEPEEDTTPYARSSLLRDVVGVAVDNNAPGTFTMGPRDQEKRSLQSQWIIIGGAIVVMIALVIALTTITSDVRDILKDPLATSPAVTTPAPTEAEETDEAPVEPTAEETEEALPAPEVEGVELLALPAGQEPDHTDQQERLTDGDTSTYWSTQHYASPDFGGLKEGVGIRVHFSEASTFTALTLTTAKNNGGVVELRTVNEDGSPGEVLSTGEFVADGEVRLEAPEEMETDAVMVWIPELPPDSVQDGRFRARIAEIQAE